MFIFLQNDARDTIVGVEAGSAGGLTEVQIGIAVDGEEDSTIACWRYLIVSFNCF